MTLLTETANTKAGDLAQLVSGTNKVYLIHLEVGGELHTHRGVIRHDELIGQPWGSQVFSHLGSGYFLLQPSLNDLMREIKRNTQIMYPKDVGFILMTMGIGPGVHVIEAGSGSGSLTTALAWAVGPQGRVYSYEIRQEMQNLARKNLERVGMQDRVVFKLRDIAEGFDEQGVDALFLDVPNPYDYLAQARQALKPGGYFGTLQPTTNQVSRLLDAFYRYDYSFIDVCEVIVRYYKAVAERFRPTDRMIAHTGYLIFARSILIDHERKAPTAETTPAEAAEPGETPDLAGQPADEAELA